MERKGAHPSVRPGDGTGSARESLFMKPARLLSEILGVLILSAVSVPGGSVPRPFLKGCGRYTGRWAGRPRSYDIQCWDLMAEAGVTITGAQLTWYDAEPVQGSYDWDEIDYADFEVREIRERGMEVAFFLGLTPDWAKLRPDLPPHRTPPAEEYVDEFMDFHRFVADRYKGKVRYYYFWNEPNGCSWINDGCSNSGEYALYSRWLIRCSQAVKSVDPDAKIIAGRLDYNAGVTRGYEYIEGMYDSGAGPWFDGIAIHPYDWAGTLHWQAIIDTRSVLVAHGDGDKEIWLTEYGWNSGSEQERADKVTAVLEELHKPEWSFVTMANYLVLNDGSGVENYGLTDANLNPRPAYYAFRDFVPAYESSPIVLNPSFEQGNGLTSWHMVPLGGEGPDIPSLDNTNPYGPRTPFGERFGGKVTSWLAMDFMLGQIIDVTGTNATYRSVDWDLSAWVNLHCRHTGEDPQPENVHQVWEVGWNEDGSMPEGIEDCDRYETIAEIDGTFTENDRVGFHPLERSGRIDGSPRYVVFRVRMFNDEPREWTISNIDNVSFTAEAVPQEGGILSAY